MLKTSTQLKNHDKIEAILKEMVKYAYEEIKDEPVLLCLECSDVDLYVAASNHEELEDALKENFELDEFGEVIDLEAYQELFYELNDHFVELHKLSGYFDFFPEGVYDVNGEKRESETDMLAVKGKFYAPFEDALND
ncbi:hypothetical protein CVD25_08320 [Bacillus canaveralius]|uniref:Uncharacterized protein n=1 Tax=Bacillus canaveralius TaxID=1403243 RepID=A0A2N5GIE1_9BACI|nr:MULTISPECIES: hypothetical protein [Bacillus]PLR80759.1 hypothetical protein CU635_17050 [Bacillus canaveralius]PLR81749.1 hypothetical protein CVD23_18420 [Bacillus sp. V33-4]PLR98363.1 hypothetical protein CVD25_08320 [Bacillus canaveralius]